MVDQFIFIAVRGIGIGAIYSLVAMSFNIVHGSSGILNFAQGNMLILGGLTAYMLSGNSVEGLGIWMIAIPLAGIAISLLLTAQGWLTLLPLRFSTEQDSWIISTMAASTIIGALQLLLQGPWTQTVSSPLPSINVLGARTPAPYVLAIGFAVAWFIALRWFLSRTLTGLAISALSQDLQAARAAGLKVRRLQLLAFSVSGLIVGTTGFVCAPVISLGADTGFKYILNGFLVCIIGGLGSNAGALVAGPAVGVITMLATFTIGGEFQTLTSLTLLLVVLLTRPQGLFGRAAARRV
jgi:branched-chain amino acid transport system permease protein